MANTRKQRGDAAEAAAADFLIAQGLTPVASNQHCRFGEIDLIMQDQEMLVFIEVRARRSKQFGGAAASVSPTKQKKLILAATHFLSENAAFSDAPCRFDVIAFEGESAFSAPIWYKDAFRP